MNEPYQMPSFSNGSPLHIDLSQHHPDNHSHRNNIHKPNMDNLDNSDVENALILDNLDNHHMTSNEQFPPSGRR